MKEFMLIFLRDSYQDLGLSPEQMQERMGSWFAWHGKMAEAGIIKHGNALQDSVRHISGESRTVTDRTSTEVKELIGGYYVIEVADIGKASEIAQGYPDYDLGGTVEIREIMVFE